MHHMIGKQLNSLQPIMVNNYRKDILGIVCSSISTLNDVAKVDGIFNIVLYVWAIVLSVHDLTTEASKQQFSVYRH